MSADGDIDAQLVFLLQLSAEIAAIVGITAAGMLAAEERHGRTGLLLSTSINRWTWSLSGTAVALTSSVVTLIVLAASTGIGASISTGNRDQIWQAIASGLAYAPAVIWCAALALLLCMIRPGLNAVMWAIIGWAIIVTLPSQLLDLGEIARNLSPFEWMGEVAQSQWQSLSALGTSIAAVLALTAGAMWFRRRDLIAG